MVFSLEFHHRKNILSPWPPLITSTVCSLLLMPLILDYDTPCFCFEKHCTTSWVEKAIDGSISTVAWQHHHDPLSRYFCISQNNPYRDPLMRPKLNHFIFLQITSTTPLPLPSDISVGVPMNFVLQLRSHDNNILSQLYKLPPPPPPAFMLKNYFINRDVFIPPKLYPFMFF